MRAEPSQNRNRLEHEKDLRSVLRPDEEISWWGRPRQGLVFRPLDVFLVPFSVVWAGGVFSWMAAAISTGAPFFFLLFGTPFVLAGLYITVGRFLVDIRIRKNTLYAVTGSDAVVVSGLFSKSVKRVGLKTVSDITLHEKSNGTGTITLGPSSMNRAFYMPGLPAYNVSPSFDMIDNAREVYEIIQKNRAS